MEANNATAAAGASAMFEESYRDAKAFHRRALRFADVGWDVELVFNVAAIALERYLVALCCRHGMEPESHSFVCLMNAIDKCMDIPHELSRSIRSLDRIFGICSIDSYRHEKTGADDASRALRLCSDVSSMINQLPQCPPK
ncbi:MAG: hypothetical protein LBO71_04535 [Prevotellaceae bacterium]|jgi:HEPN domain-containing protein|nr:hypothetical protein [Prevotellaceae bacterium]